MTFLTILKIISYIVVGGIPSALGIIGYFKQRKKHQTEIDEKDELIHSLQNTVREMVILQGDINEVDRTSKQTKKDNASMSDDDLNINYHGKLPDMPTKRDRKRKKKT